MTAPQILTFATNNIGRAVIINFLNAEYRWRHYRVEDVDDMESQIAVTSMTDDEGERGTGYFKWIEVAGIMYISLRS